MRFSSLLLAAASLASAMAISNIEPIVQKGRHYFGSVSGDEFFVCTPLYLSPCSF